MTALLALLTMVTIGTPCTNGRAAPTLSAPVTACLAAGTSVNLTTQVVDADGHEWHQTDAGIWIASDYLSSQSQAGVLTPPPAPPMLASATAGSGQSSSSTGGGASSPLVPPLTAVLDQAAAPVSSAVTSSQVVSEIEKQATSAGLRPACVEALSMRESGNDPSKVNPYSGARGLFGWLPVGGEWSSTPLGRSGVSVAQATVQQQVAMAVWALLDGDGGGAWGQSDNCH